MSNVQCADFGDHLFDYHIAGDFVFVPSFSVGAVSVGFGVQECSKQSFAFAELCEGRPDYFGCDVTSHFRFVRDDSNGVLILVFRDSSSGTIKMDVMDHLGASVRRRSFVVFDEQRLRNAIHTERGILQPEYVLPALKMLSIVLESKKCPHCSSPPNFSCDCKLDTEVPKHPLDFSALRKNMHAFVGAYEGLARNVCFEGGNPVLSANVGSVINIEGGVDDDLIARLSRWAITDHLKDRKENPIPLLMPLRGSNNDDDDVDVIDMAIDTGIMAQGSVGLPGILGSLIDPMANGSSCSSGSGILVAESLEDSGPNETVQERSAVSSLFENVSPESGRMALNDEALDLVNKITGDADMGMEDLYLAGIGEQSLESLSSEDTEVPNVDPVATGSEQQAPEKTVASRTRAIAPSAPVENSGNREQGEKEHRAQLRRQRNREAAQRSNMKRKIKNDTLKNSLKETHAKAAELRAKELALREENLQLRKLTST